MEAQKVGLVLSGGGAKGLTHIGIIRALEENEIPIDYITGTSMGAIVGSLYAMGYSPDEMEQLLKSDDFKRWYSGDVEEKYIYYFKKNPPTPEFINIRISLKDSLKSVKPHFLPNSIVDPIQMNIVFLQLFAQSTAACKENFDSLFIPFRCIASDVYNKRAMILKDGDLGDAVRASMSFPAMFKPIEIDSILAYDGGIYNNFPVNVMKDDFHPDIIIGSTVSTNPGKPKEGDIMGQLENMIMQKTDYTLPDSLGILLTFKYDNVNLMDFNRFDELHDIGYKRTLEMMDSIKSRIHRRVNPAQIEARRLAYKSNLPELRFKKVNITGANERQKQYIRKEFHENNYETFTIEDVKQGYFRLLSDNIISEIIPHAVYNKEDGTYDLNLQVKMEANLSARVGGNVSSSGANQVYFGASYQNLNYYSKEFTFDGQLGRIYNNLQLAARIDFPTRIPTSYRFMASISTFDYYKEEKLFSNNDNPAFNKKKEEFVKIKAALPFLSRKKAEFGIGIARIQDRYFQTNIIDFSQAKHDRSTYDILGGSIVLEGSTLNARQFATQGSREKMAAQIFTGREKFKAGNPQAPVEIKVIPVVPSVKLAKRVEEAGVDAMVIEGMEGGGHIGQQTTMALMTNVLPLIKKVPVLVAGGISDGRGIAAALMMGADGVQMGSRFILTDECPTHPKAKEAIIKATDTDSAVTGFSRNNAVRCLKNEFTKEYLEKECSGAPQQELNDFATGTNRLGAVEGDINHGAVLVGQSLNVLNDILPCAEVMERLIAEARDTLANAKNIVL